MVINVSNSSITSSLRHFTPRDGYDLPLYGIEDGRFNVVHVSALACISLSLCCVMVVLVLCRRELKGKTNKPKSFYKWTKGERLSLIHI